MLRRGLIRDERGSVAVITALGMVAVVGFAGLAVDVGAWQSAQRRMQSAADNAAYTAAVASHNGGTPTLAAKGITASMGFADTYNLALNQACASSVTQTCVEVNNPPTKGSYAGNGNAWEVIVTKPQQRWFAHLFLSSNPLASGRAVAHAQASGSPYCVLALNPSASQAVSVQGGAQVNLSNCSMQVNSSDSAALSVAGSSSLTADTASVTGYYAVGSSSTLSTTDPIDAPGAQPILDPYARVSVPSYSCSGGYNKNIAAGTVPEGVYCQGMNFTGNDHESFTLSGTYIVSGKNSCFCVGGNVVVTGTATIILTDGASVTINGGSTVNLTAPGTGPYAGLIFFQDRNDNSAAKLTGGTGQTYTGTLYFAGAQLTYNGDSGGSSCTQIVADTIVWSGSSTVGSSCTGLGIPDITSYPTALAE